MGNDTSVQGVDNVGAGLAVLAISVGAHRFFHLTAIQNLVFLSEVVRNVKESSLAAEIPCEAFLSALGIIDEAPHQVGHVAFGGAFLRNS